MRISALTYGVGLLAFATGPALANESVMEATKNPQNWAMQQGDYSNHRYSKLDQINTKNVGRFARRGAFRPAFSEVTKDRLWSSAT